MSFKFYWYVKNLIWDCKAFGMKEIVFEWIECLLNFLKVYKILFEWFDYLLKISKGYKILFEWFECLKTFHEV